MKNNKDTRFIDSLITPRGQPFSRFLTGELYDGDGDGIPRAWDCDDSRADRDGLRDWVRSKLAKKDTVTGSSGIGSPVLKSSEKMSRTGGYISVSDPAVSSSQGGGGTSGSVSSGSVSGAISTSSGGGTSSRTGGGGTTTPTPTQTSQVSRTVQQTKTPTLSTGGTSQQTQTQAQQIQQRQQQFLALQRQQQQSFIQRDRGISRRTPFEEATRPTIKKERDFGVSVGEGLRPLPSEVERYDPKTRMFISGGKDGETLRMRPPTPKEQKEIDKAIARDERIESKIVEPALGVVSFGARKFEELRESPTGKRLDLVYSKNALGVPKLKTRAEAELFNQTIISETPVNALDIGYAIPYAGQTLLISEVGKGVEQVSFPEKKADKLLKETWEDYEKANLKLEKG